MESKNVLTFSTENPLKFKSEKKAKMMNKCSQDKEKKVQFPSALPSETEKKSDMTSSQLMKSLNSSLDGLFSRINKLKS